MATRFVSKARQGAKILLIDDNRSGLMARRAVLEELGYTTKGLSCPLEALKTCGPGNFDLIVTDYRLPGINGMEAVRLLRKNLMPLIPFVTAYDEYAVRAFELNAVDYLLKPVDHARFAKRSIARRREWSFPNIRSKLWLVSMLPRAATQRPRGSKFSNGSR